MPTGFILELKMSFGENLKRLRRDKGWTQAQLAKHADVKQTHIPSLENDSGDPKLSTVYKLMNALGCSADALLMDADKVGLEGILAAMIERVGTLPEMNKRVLIDVIDKYCIATGLENAFKPENKHLFMNFRTLHESFTSALPDDEKAKL